MFSEQDREELQEGNFHKDLGQFPILNLLRRYLRTNHQLTYKHLPKFKAKLIFELKCSPQLITTRTRTKAREYPLAMSSLLEFPSSVCSSTAY